MYLIQILFPLLKHCWIDGMRRDGCGALKTGEPRFGDLGGKIIIVWGMFGNASVYFGSKGKGLVWIQ